MEQRVCNRCSKSKDLTKFKLDPKGKSRRRTCNACNQRAYYQRKGRRRTDIAVASKKRIENIAWVIHQDSRSADRQRGHANDLDHSFIESLIQRPCTYCGETELRMTLDRINNDLGHLRENVVPACIRCNLIRRNMPYEAWLCLVAGLQEARVKGLFGDWTGKKSPSPRD